MPQKSILILSGGLDSTVSSWIAREKTKPILALTFDYGQRAVKQEIDASAHQAKVLGVDHKVIRLPWLAEIVKTPLVNPKKGLPKLSEKELDNSDKTFASARAVWVPNRNGLFLNIGASFAEALEAEVLVTGFNAEEGITFPDNSVPFIRAADEFFWYSTLKRVRVASYTAQMTKLEIAKKARELGIEIDKVWFCYDGGPAPCQKCESCLRSHRAFRQLAA